MAAHLLKTQDNEHIEVHELRGFLSDDLHAALHEIYAVSRGTRAKQFMFSLSLSPPADERVPIEVFEEAIEARFLSEVKHWSITEISNQLNVNRTTLWRTLRC